VANMIGTVFKQHLGCACIRVPLPRGEGPMHICWAASTAAHDSHCALWSAAARLAVCWLLALVLVSVVRKGNRCRLRHRPPLCCW
jgi:hypothetical protein